MGIKDIPEEITMALVECIVMPDGEVISSGRTLGYVRDFIYERRGEQLTMLFRHDEFTRNKEDNV